MKIPLVPVKPVADRLVVEPFVMVPEVMVVVARVEVPMTVRVPCEVKVEVAVMSPPVSVLIVPVIARRVVAKR